METMWKYWIEYIDPAEPAPIYQAHAVSFAEEADADTAFSELTEAGCHLIDTWVELHPLRYKAYWRGQHGPRYRWTGAGYEFVDPVRRI